MKITIPPKDWPICMEAVDLIATSEQGPNGGPALKAYRCPAGVWTYGFGMADGVTPGMTCTEPEAWDILLRDLKARASAVTEMLKAPANDYQLGAMTSLVYNIGLAGFKNSSVLRLHNAGNAVGAARAFALWNKAKVGGVLTVLNGLTARRAAEAALYLHPDPQAWREPMAQAVEPEQAPLASRRMLTGGATVGLGVIGAMGELKDALGPVGESVASAKGFLADLVGIPAPYMPLALLVLVGGFLVWHFTQARARGES